MIASGQSTYKCHSYWGNRGVLVLFGDQDFCISLVEHIFLQLYIHAKRNDQRRSTTRSSC